MSNATILLARRSIRARIGRLIAIAVAIVLAVSFVVATSVLAESLRTGFDELFSDLTENVDLEVRSAVTVGDVTESSERDPVPDSLVATVADVPGVAAAEGVIDRTIVVVDADGEPLEKGGAPTYLIAWFDSDLSATEVVEGAAPSGDDIVLDRATADDQGLGVGDTLVYVTDTGRQEASIVGLIDTASGDGFGGATVVMAEPETVAAVTGANGVVDVIDIAVDEGTDAETVQQAIAEVLPDGVEVIDQQTLLDESNESVNEFITPLSTGLLVFAFITAFISAFLINNVFAITIGQRLRELALLRAVGGGGAQVRRLIVVEAVLMSIVATIVGVGGGLLVARLLLGIFNSAGAGFPDMPLILRPTAVIMAFVVGVGITLLAVLVPARRASRIPPVAAMRPELGFQSLSAGRLVASTVMLAIGAVAFLVGIFVRPGGTPGMIALAGGGALLIFVGAAGAATTVARPVTRAIGAPVAKVFGAAGQLARENAGRSPRRTAATVSALMIGVALISAAAVFASSLQTSFREAIDEGVTADVVVVSSSADTGGLLPAAAADVVAEQPEVAAATGIRFASVLVDGTQKSVGIADAVALPQLIDLGVSDGDIAELADGMAISSAVADDNDYAVGDTLDITFANGEVRSLPVAAIYDNTTFAQNWLLSAATFDEVVSGQQTTFFIPVKLDEGVELDAGVVAIETALAAQYPQAQVQSAEQFKDEQAGQINQLLVIISALLALSIIIAVLGISITLGLAVFERTREIGLMRAVGMTKRQTRRMVRWEAIIVSVFGAVIGIALGTLIGVALTLAIPDDIISGVSFNWALIVVILVGAVVAGFIAALYPSVKSSRLDVLTAIATE